MERLMRARAAPGVPVAPGAAEPRLLPGAPALSLQKYALAGCALGLVCACSLQDFDALGRARETGAAAAGGMAGASGSGAGGRGAEDAGDSGSEAGPADAPPPRVNLIPDPSFEAGHAGWVGFGGSDVQDRTTNVHSGARCIASLDRALSTDGPAYRIDLLVARGEAYVASAWVRLDEGSDSIGISIKAVCSETGEAYTPIALSSVSTEWRQLEGEFAVPSCTLTELRIYLEGPAAGTVFYVDDVGLYSAS